MTRILCIGDPHFKQKNVLRYQQMSKHILEQASNMVPDAIVILGDTLHTHETAHQTPFDMACEFIIRLSEIALTIVIIGNHDYINNQQFLSDKHFFNPLKRLPNIIIVDDVKTIKIGRYVFGACPYVCPGLLKKALLSRLTLDNLKRCRAIFAHQEMYGVPMGAIKSEIGDTWETELPLLITGHVHAFYKLASNVLYIGTPIQHNFNDSCDKGIYLIDFQLNKHTLRKFIINVPLKRTYRLNVQEFRELVIPANIEAKIVLKATTTEFAKLEEEGLVAKVRSTGALVIHEDTAVANLLEQVNTEESFLEVLYKKIQHDSMLIESYREIFGGSETTSAVELKSTRKVVVIKK